MAKEKSCMIHDLEGLLGGLNHFELLQPHLSNSDNSGYDKFMKEYIYPKNKEILSWFKSIGDSREDVEAWLKKHILGCEECQEKYKVYLDEQAEDWLKLGKAVYSNPKLRGVIENITEKGYLYYIAKADILNLREDLKKNSKK